MYKYNTFLADPVHAPCGFPRHGAGIFWPLAAIRARTLQQCSGKTALEKGSLYTAPSRRKKKGGAGGVYSKSAP